MKTKPTPSFNIGLFILSLTVPLAAGVIGSFFTSDAIPTWYAELAKPGFNPPNWIFGPMWTALYILQGIALYLILTTRHANKSKAIGVFATQIIANTLWSIIFFGAKSPMWAFVNIIILLGLILWTIKLFGTIKPIAAKLLIPYLLWVSFAAILNASIIALN